MKNLVIIFGMVTIVTMFQACNTEAEKRSEVFILVDNTEKCLESKENLISKTSLLSLVGNNGNVKWKQLNAVTLNTDTTIGVTMPPDATNLQRKDQLDPFIETLELLRKRYLGPVQTGTEASALYKPICEAITGLNNSTADQRTLIIVSDMVENSSFGNFYKPQSFEKVKQVLDSSGVYLPKSSKVNVIILFDPEGNRKKEAQFDQAMKIWSKLFDEAGIKYQTKANL